MATGSGPVAVPRWLIRGLSATRRLRHAGARREVLGVTTGAEGVVVVKTNPLSEPDRPRDHRRRDPPARSRRSCRRWRTHRRRNGSTRSARRTTSPVARRICGPTSAARAPSSARRSRGPSSPPAPLGRCLRWCQCGPSSKAFAGLKSRRGKAGRRVGALGAPVRPPVPDPTRRRGDQGPRRQLPVRMSRERRPAHAGRPCGVRHGPGRHERRPPDLPGAWRRSGRERLGHWPLLRGARE